MTMRKVQFREALNEAMCEEMERDASVFLIGEEVAQYNGAYKVSQGMWDKFGDKRVIDTPIAELGFAGIAIGAAMGGLRPIVEMMTFNFAILALDQVVNTAAKVRYMSNGQISCPIVIRGAGGAGGSLGAQHSQSLEAQYMHFPGLKVMIPSTPYDAKGMLKTAIRDPDPVIFIESEIMYRFEGEIPDEEYTIPMGKGDIKRAGTDCTVVAWSRMVHVALEAAKILSEEHGIEIEIVDPRTLRPLDKDIIRGSVKKTNRAVVAEEGWSWASAGASIAEFISRDLFDHLDAPVERVHQREVPMPYAHNLEPLSLPNAQKIVEAVRRACYR
jgi:pyruvate dehydrogenase E1 component beta subunit